MKRIITDQHNNEYFQGTQVEVESELKKIRANQEQFNAGYTPSDAQYDDRTYQIESSEDFYRRLGLL